jgi:hypothetical protein
MFAFVQDVLRILSTLTEWYEALLNTPTALFSS